MKTTSDDYILPTNRCVNWRPTNRPSIQPILLKIRKTRTRHGYSETAALPSTFSPKNYTQNMPWKRIKVFVDFISAFRRNNNNNNNDCCKTWNANVNLHTRTSHIMFVLAVGCHVFVADTFSHFHMRWILRGYFDFPFISLIQSSRHLNVVDKRHNNIKYGCVECGGWKPTHRMMMFLFDFA